MHELSAAQNIVELIRQHTPATEWERVMTARLKIGTMAGMVPESLEFSFHAITADTPFRSVRLEIESIPFQVRCRSCGRITENETGLLVCEACGSMEGETVSGTEFFLSEIEIAEPV